ncbi:MAG: DUF87 domain-containing protein [Sebaldella sp.]|nr:DUF87 domain-containing protein [Sebaldella sp.]
MTNSKKKMLRGFIFTTIGIVILLLLLYKKILIYKNDKAEQNLFLTILNSFEITFGKMLLFVVFSLIFFGLVQIYTSKSKIRVDKAKLYAYIILFLSMSLYFTKQYITVKLPDDFFESGRRLLEIGFNTEKYPGSGGLIGSLLSFPFYKIIYINVISIMLMIIIVFSMLFLLKDFIGFTLLLIMALIKYYRSEEYKKKAKILRAKKIIERKEQQSLKIDQREEIKNRIIESRKKKLSFEISKKPKVESQEGQEHYDNKELEKKQKEWLNYLEEIKRDKELKKQREREALEKREREEALRIKENKINMEELIRESMAKSEEKVQEEVMTSEEPDFSIEETIPEVVSENYKPVYENTVEELTENPIIAEELENQILESELLEDELNENILMNEKDDGYSASLAEYEEQEEIPYLEPNDYFVDEEISSNIEIEAENIKNDEVKITEDVPYKNIETKEVSEFHKISIDDIFIHKEPDESKRKEMEKVIEENVTHLESVLKEFGIDATVVDYQRGPTITRYELIIPRGIRVNKVTALADDIAMNLSAESIRIEAPIPGKNTIGIETPNKVKEPVYFANLVRNKELDEKGSLKIILGKDIVGRDKIIDIAKMPHLLIAGQTGSGKSVAVNTLVASLISKRSFKEVKFIMVDPKMVELMPFNGIPHLLLPVIIDPKQASIALKWAVAEMENRYRMLMEVGVRNIQSYNEIKGVEKMPFIIIIIDELADLMMVAAGSVEESIARIAQKARAIGIHLVVATQRPSTDVITGMIKANLPSRISFALRSQIDSRTILDSPGAEKLLGKGDMLLLESGSSKLERIQGAFISDDEVHKLTSKLKESYKTNYNEEILLELENDVEKDELFNEAVEVIRQEGKASISLIQRKLKIGFNRASRIYEQLMECGIINEDKQVMMDEDTE